ncbi:protein IWS1 homolog 1 isoform X2 [Musa acuminata AAA Group]|uniref:protein IWS1 homolog 1 isoform X2 n=1 Tax=Musa acuminata AAA Group TaxID=214697 RepID=UPI0031E431A3
MAFGNDGFLDEDGETLMVSNMPSCRERSLKPADRVDDDGNVDGRSWRWGRSLTPVMDSANECKGGKPRKRLIMKTANEGPPHYSGGPMAAFGDEGLDKSGNVELSLKKKRKGTPSTKQGKVGSGKERRLSSSSKGNRPFGSGSRNTIARGELEAEEGEEDDEIQQLFNGGGKKKKNEKFHAEISLLVEHVMAELEVVTEEDAELNRQNKPAINKLRKLPLLVEALSKKTLQQDFLDHGVLYLLKNWLEPLPDGSFPNMNVRTAILKVLSDFPIDLEQYDRREQLKRSGIGKVIMFLSKSDEETTSNRKLAKELVDRWSRSIFNKSTRFEDMRTSDEEREPYRRPSQKHLHKARRLESQDNWIRLDLDELSNLRRTGQAATRQHVSVPEALPLDFVVRPRSLVDPEEVRAQAKQVMHDQHRLKINKKLWQLKTSKKRQLQALKPSSEGRGIVMYL